MSEQIRGSCLCGRVQFTVSSPFDAFHLCHCSRCRKDTGSAHASNIFAAPDAIRWLAGRESVRRFDLPQAQRFSRAFCSHCGSLVPYVNRGGTYLVVPAGCLDDEPGVAPQDNIHWKSRAGWCEAGLSAPRYDEEPED